MEIDIKKVKSGSMDGIRVYICDYRRPDLDKKPARSVAPQLVVIRPNSDLPKGKNIYYSESHFRPIGKNGKELSKVIPIFDNTGFRSYEGVPLKIFDNLDECVKCYQHDLTEVVKSLKEKQDKIVAILQKEIDDVNDLSEKALK